ncbi:MAG: FtsX-like permease family protein [Puniceicoccales bacterium]|jgi:lipoprotein-releasing system permease protein|nr:FtsX-like permease family protein [Puniceicoccales bacterium]
MINSWCIFWAWNQLFPNGRKGIAFAILSILGVAFGVCILVVVLGVMNGFQDDIRSKLIGIRGDICVESSRTGGEELFKWKMRLGEKEEVHKVAEFTHMPVFFMHDERFALPILKIGDQGADGLIDFAVTRERDTDGVWLGCDLAEELQVAVGEAVSFFSPEILMNLENVEELPEILEINVAGIFQTGWPDIDGHIAFISREEAEWVLEKPPPIQGFDVFLKNGANAVAVRDEWNASFLPPFLRAKSWQEVNVQLCSVLGMEKAAMCFVLLAVLFVATFSMASALLLNVVRKTREIGLLRVFGASRFEVALCYLLQGGIVGLLGAGLGLAISAIILWWRDEILSIVFRLFKNGDQIFAFYQFSHLPLLVRNDEVAIICFAAIFLAMLAGVIPAVRAANIDPAKAMCCE